jgi:hypothetical protein
MRIYNEIFNKYDVSVYDRIATTCAIIVTKWEIFVTLLKFHHLILLHANRELIIKKRAKLFGTGIAVLKQVLKRINQVHRTKPVFQ